jgi:hypothetical protein
MVVTCQLHAPAILPPVLEPPEFFDRRLGGSHSRQEKRISCHCWESNPVRPARSQVAIPIGLSFPYYYYYYYLIKFNNTSWMETDGTTGLPIEANAEYHTHFAGAVVLDDHSYWLLTFLLFLSNLVTISSNDLSRTSLVVVFQLFNLLPSDCSYKFRNAWLASNFGNNKFICSDPWSYLTHSATTWVTIWFYLKLSIVVLDVHVCKAYIRRSLYSNVASKNSDQGEWRKCDYIKWMLRAIAKNQ